jgi:hypothetical protein
MTVMSLLSRVRAVLGPLGLGVAALLSASSSGLAAENAQGTSGIFGHKGSGASIFSSMGSRPQNPEQGTAGIFGHTNGAGITGLFRGIENTALPAPAAPSTSPQTYQPSRPPEGLVLTGVVIAGEKALGFVQDPKLTDNKIVAVRKGDTLGPYTVTAIESDRMNLEGPNGPVTIRLARQTGTSVGATPQASSSDPAKSRTGTAPRGSAPAGTDGTGPR